MSTEHHLTSAEIVERIDKRRAALTWENFLKYLANGSTETQAREYLENKLQEYLNAPPREFKAPLLQDPDKDVEELLLFLKNDKLEDKKSKIWPLLERKRVDDDDGEYRKLLELRRSYFETKERIDKMVNLINNSFEQMDATRGELRPKIKKLPFTPDEYELEDQFNKLNGKITELKRQFVKLKKKFEDDQIARNWAAEDNLRKNPDGIREATKWIRGIISELNEISPTSRSLKEQLGQIEEKLEQIGNKPQRKIDVDQT